MAGRYYLTDKDRKLVKETIKAVRGGTGVPSRRPVPTRRRDPGGAAKKYDSAYGTVSAADVPNKVYTLSATPVQLPTGAKVIPTGTLKVFDLFDVTPSVSDLVRIDYSEGAYDDTAGSNTHGVVNWIISPGGGSSPVKVVQVYHSTLSDGEAVDPVYGRNFRGNLAGPDDIWIESLDTESHPNVRASMPAAGYFIGVYSGTYDPHDDDSEISTDERDLYRVQPIPSRVLLGLVTSEASAADWSDTAIPVEGTGQCTIYRYLEDDSLEVNETSVTFFNMAEATIAAGSIIYLESFEGRLHVVTQMCASASGYSEE